MTCNEHISRWIRMVETGETEACEEQKSMVAWVRRCFETEDIYTDDTLLEKYLGIAKYFPFERLFPWEAFCIALHLCTFWRDTGMPRWPDLFLLIGRGAGKDGFIAVESLCLVSPYHTCRQYDVDICAIAEEQAMRPVNDIIAALEDVRNYNKLQKHFHWTKKQIIGRKNGGVIKGRTNNPDSKQGMRSGIVVFNELHTYKNNANLKVFIAGLGKRPHPRRLYATTNGDVREGPLDELLARSERILEGSEEDGGLLPFICRLDDKSEADNPDMWVKANPSLPYLPNLKAELIKQHAEWKANPTSNADFMTTRMNLPQMDADVAVTDYENIKATNRPLPDMTGWECVAGMDYASVSDFASTCLLFRRGEERFVISHSWLCLQSRDLSRIKAPWREWVQAGLLTVVDAVEIHPDLLAEWFFQKAQRYVIKKLALDNNRYALVTRSLDAVGYDPKERKNTKLVRPSDIMKVHPVIESAFNNRSFVWGDNPVLRWAANNTKLVRSSRNIGCDTGNYIYAKIEAKSRKNDPFMALVAAMALDNELEPSGSTFDDLPVIL